jgi:hypothetical protein
VGGAQWKNNIFVRVLQQDKSYIPQWWDPPNALVLLMHYKHQKQMNVIMSHHANATASNSHQEYRINFFISRINDPFPESWQAVSPAERMSHSIQNHHEFQSTSW